MTVVVKHRINQNAQQSNCPLMSNNDSSNTNIMTVNKTASTQTATTLTATIKLNLLKNLLKPFQKIVKKPFISHIELLCASR